MALRNRVRGRQAAGRGHVDTTAFPPSQVEIAAARQIRAAVLTIVARLDAGLGADTNRCADAVDSLRSLLVEQLRLFDPSRPLSDHLLGLTGVCDRYLIPDDDRPSSGGASRAAAELRAGLVASTVELATDHGIEQEVVRVTGREAPRSQPGQARPAPPPAPPSAPHAHATAWAAHDVQPAVPATPSPPVLEWPQSTAPPWPGAGAPPAWYRGGAAPPPGPVEASWGAPATLRSEPAQPAPETPPAARTAPRAGPPAAPAEAEAVRSAAAPRAAEPREERPATTTAPPVRATSALRLAARLRREGDLEGARAILERTATDADAGVSAAAAVELGLVLREQGDQDGAKAAFRRALQGREASTVGRASLHLGLLLSEEGDLAGAEAAFRRSAGSGDHAAAVWAIAQLGLMAADRDDLAGARAIWLDGRTCGHDLGSALVGVGRVLLAEGRPEAAAIAFGEALESPDESAADEAAAQLRALG